MTNFLQNKRNRFLAVASLRTLWLPDRIGGLRVEYQAHVNLKALEGRHDNNMAIYINRNQLLENLGIINDIKLTVREIESLSLWVGGATSKQSGDILNISSKTIESYRDNVKYKLSVYSKKQFFCFGRHCIKQ